MKRGRLLGAYTGLVIAYLCLPIFVMILFGFNDTKGRYNFTWQGFTLSWYRHLFDIGGLTDALVNSLTIAVFATILSVVLGTTLGLAIGRYRFRGKAGLDLMLFAQIATPEIVLGASLLSLFISLGVPRGYVTILVAHVMFCIPFVAITVQARVVGLDRSLEEAALDLGATPLVTFRKVTLPLIMPAVLAGGLLSFALSIDDFVTTSFNAGQTSTFPLWVYGASRIGVPPQVNVMGTLIFVVGVGFAVVTAFSNRQTRGGREVGAR
ncbi:MAG: spermidine/putrescine transport system permease protein [Frankiaceae bacterium]|nr:spermidine/putrescine transport system permease protein [Frankiaceae bacterium]